VLAIGARGGLLARAGHLPRPWVALWALGSVALAILGSFGSGPSGRFVADPVGGKVYLGVIAALAAVVVWSAKRMRAPFAAGVGLVAAGVLTLVLSGAWASTWRVLGGIGSGQANLRGRDAPRGVGGAGRGMAGLGEGPRGQAAPRDDRPLAGPADRSAGAGRRLTR